MLHNLNYYIYIVAVLENLYFSTYFIPITMGQKMAKFTSAENGARRGVIYGIALWILYTFNVKRVQRALK